MADVKFSGIPAPGGKVNSTAPKGQGQLLRPENVLFGHQPATPAATPALPAPAASEAKDSKAKAPAPKGPSRLQKLKTWCGSTLSTVRFWRKKPPTPEKLWPQIKKAFEGIPTRPPIDTRIEEGIQGLNALVSLIENKPTQLLEAAEYYEKFSYYRNKVDTAQGSQDLKQTAIATYKKAMDAGFHDGYGNVQRAIAKLYARAGQFDEALAERQQYADRFPENAQGHVDLGETWMKSLAEPRPQLTAQAFKEWSQNGLKQASAAFEKATAALTAEDTALIRNTIAHWQGRIKDMQTGVRHLNGQYNGRPRY